MIRVQRLTSDPEVIVSTPPTPLSPELEAEVDIIWGEERVERGPTLFNGRVFSLDGKLGSGQLSGHFAEYRLLVAQQRRPSLYRHLRIAPLAVSGFLRCRDGLVFGRRHRASTQDAGLWELVPSGSVDVRALKADGRVDVRRQVLEELAEEVGIGADQVTSIEPIFLAEDGATHIFDLVFAMAIRLTGNEVLVCHAACRSDEYTELNVVQFDRVTAFAARLGEELAQISQAILQYKQFTA